MGTSISSGQRNSRRRFQSIIEPLERRTLLTVVPFTIDPTKSSLAASGSAAGFALSQQVSGSLNDAYSGTISANVTATTIQFTTPSAAAAKLNPNQHLNPGNTTANYGGQASTILGPALVAVRNLIGSITSAALILGSGGTFTSSGEHFAITSGKADYTSPLGNGSQTLVGLNSANQAAAKSSLVVSGGVATLTIPVNITLNYTLLSANDSHFTLTGKLVATAKLGSISGNIFKDVNGNGTKDSGDAAFAGVKVFLDANKNGKLDAGEITTTTDSSGNYKFANLYAGSYRVAQVVPAGYRISTPASGSFDVSLTAAALNATGKTFGDTQRVLISGTVFNDANSDKTQESTEKGLSGWRVFIDTNNDGKWEASEASVLTDANGNWAFTNLPAGSFAVRIVQQTGFTRTTTLPAKFTLASGGTKTKILFGEHKP
jgi:hypothetical protein